MENKTFEFSLIIQTIQMLVKIPFSLCTFSFYLGESGLRFPTAKEP